jgi:hypothetical protein
MQLTQFERPAIGAGYRKEAAVKKIVILILATLMLLGIVGSGAFGFYSDQEQSVSNSMVGKVLPTVTTLLNDSFAGTPWNGNWDGNGVSNWVQDSTGRSDAKSAHCDKGNKGNFTSDNLNTTGATQVTVSFWYRPVGLGSSNVTLQIYNGATYQTWYDMATYPATVNDSWCYFSQTISDAQYMKSNFRIRFTSNVNGGKTFNLDDMLVTKQ